MPKFSKVSVWKPLVEINDQGSITLGPGQGWHHSESAEKMPLNHLLLPRIISPPVPSPPPSILFLSNLVHTLNEKQFIKKDSQREEHFEVAGILYR